jgi:hypothetical protein
VRFQDWSAILFSSPFEELTQIARTQCPLAIPSSFNNCEWQLNTDKVTKRASPELQSIVTKIAQCDQREPGNQWDCFVHLPEDGMEAKITIQKVPNPASDKKSWQQPSRQAHPAEVNERVTSAANNGRMPQPNQPFAQKQLVSILLIVLAIVIMVLILIEENFFPRHQQPEVVLPQPASSGVPQRGQSVDNDIQDVSWILPHLANPQTPLFQWLFDKLSPEAKAKLSMQDSPERNQNMTQELRILLQDPFIFIDPQLRDKITLSNETKHRLRELNFLIIEDARGNGKK